MSPVNAYFRKKCEGHGNSKQVIKAVKPFLGNNSSCGSLKSGKSPGYDGMLATFFKLADANFASSLRTLFNKCISSCVFPTGMKMTELSPIFKKLDDLCKNNCRSVNILSVYSKLFESIMAEWLTTYFESTLGPLV